MNRLLVVLALLVVAGCGSDASTGDKGYVAGDGSVTTFAVADRKPAPAVSGTTLQGKQVTVKGLAQGRPTVLNVWGSWCADCRAEASVLTSAAKRLGDRASFVGVDVRDSDDNALAYERRFGITYPSIADPDGRSLLGMPKNAPVYATPSTIVLDGQGRVAASIVGPVPSALTLVELVKGAE